MTYDLDPERNAAAKAWGDVYGWRLVKKACPLYHLTGKHDRDRSCHQVPNPVSAFDHTFTMVSAGWKYRPDGEPAVITQPYALHDHQATQLTAWCEARGLTWTVYGDGWWYGGTVAIVITRRDRSR